MIAKVNVIEAISESIDEAEAVPVTTVQMSNLHLALLTYKSNWGVYPSQAEGLQALITGPKEAPVSEGWSPILISLPRDPWGHPYVYRVPSADPAKPYDLLSLGPDGKPSADDIVGR